jgi:hypothetical protein
LFFGPTEFCGRVDAGGMESGFHPAGNPGEVPEFVFVEDVG